jgi:hypothetical protein
MAESRVRLACPTCILGKTDADGAAVIGDQVALEDALLDGDGDVRGEELRVVEVASVVVEVLRDLGVVGDDENARGGVDLGAEDVGLCDYVSEPQCRHGLAEGGQFRMVEGDAGAGCLDHGGEHDDPAEETGGHVAVLPDAGLGAVGKHYRGAGGVADDISHVAEAERVADGGADAVGVDDGVVDVYVAGGVVAAEAGAAVAAAIYFDVGAVDGAVSASVEAVGYGA